MFNPAPFFLVRTPCLPIEAFFELFASDDLNASLFGLFEKNEKLLEAIAVASPSLYIAFKERSKKGLKEKEQIANSLLKYFCRMTTRSTPFGLFSFVSTGKWGMIDSKINLDQVQKRSRPDMEWLDSMIQEISSTESLFKELPVQVNPLAYQSGEVVSLNYFRKNKLIEEVENSTIRNSLLVQSILEFARFAIPVKELENKILDKHPQLIREKVLEVIKTLVREQFLTLALSPSLLSHSPFADFNNQISKIESLMDYYCLNQNLAEKIETYDKMPFGKGEAALCDLQKEIGLKFTSTSPLQVDAYYKEEFALPLQISSDLQEIAELFWKFSSKKHPLSSFHRQFLDKYGVARLVPLFELLSEEEGLGIPEYFKKPSDLDSEWAKWLKRELATALFEGKEEIVMTEEMVKGDISRAPRSFELTFEVISDSVDHLNRGEYLLYFSFLTRQGGSTFGRFVDILGNKFTSKLKEFFEKEESLEKGIFAETSYATSGSRMANVAIHPRLRKYAIDLGNSQNRDDLISLQDILVGATENHLYLNLKGTDQELIVTIGDLLNTTYAPYPLQLIRDISQTRYDQLIPFSWNHFEDFPFLPRVRYKKAILIPAQWKLNLNSLGKDEMVAWLQKWKVPRYVFLTSRDNRILLDTKHTAHLSEIGKRLLKGEEIKLVEKLGQEKGEWIESLDGHHLSEFVVPFLKNEKFANNEKLKIPKYLSVPTIHRWKTPGSEWLYAKFYLNQRNENRFLVQHLTKFIAAHDSLFDEWFFIRYKDQNTHLRIRFKGDPEKITSSLIPQFNQWVQSLLQDKLINNVQLASYEREIERYGGLEMIESAESFFCIDSIATLQLINLLFANKLNLPPYIIAALSILDLLIGFGLSPENQLTLLDIKEKQALQGFREWKSQIIPLGKAIYKNQLEENPLSPIFLKRKEAQIPFSAQLKESDSSFQIINSLIHMHCNRIMGCEIELEKKARSFAHETLKSIMYLNT